jgi:tRNA(Ile2)-agmatinylcytidine synthase
LSQSNRPTELHIGIDDTDSKLGGCTTYTAAVIFDELSKRGFRPADFPWLVRLNPNIPWKTRGNGSLALHFLVDESRVDEVRNIVLNIVEETTDTSDASTDPAVAFLRGKIPPELRDFSIMTLHDVVRVSDAKRVSRKVGIEEHVLKGPRGLIGALAAIGAQLQTAHTFEIIAYRTQDYIGTWRQIDDGSVREMDAKFRGVTFNNLDPETGRVLIFPHGPDPVLFGIRGEDPVTLAHAYHHVQVGEPVQRVMIFRTNHGTDAHLAKHRKAAELRQYQSAVVNGRVETRPRVLKGGHVVFSLRDETGSVDCAAYEPTGRFRKVVMELEPDDAVSVFGGVRDGPKERPTINLEKLVVNRLAQVVRYQKPRCAGCDRLCESMGQGQGFRCRKCGLRFPRDSLVPVVQNRGIKETVYVPPPRANRHLTMPLSRYGWKKDTQRLDDFSDSQHASYFESLLRSVQSASAL